MASKIPTLRCNLNERAFPAKFKNRDVLLKTDDELQAIAEVDGDAFFFGSSTSKT